MEDIAYKPIETVKKIYPGGQFTPPKFTPTFLEWLYMRGQIKSGNFGGNFASTWNCYTVPDGYSFFLTSVWATLSGTGADRVRHHTFYVDKYYIYTSRIYFSGICVNVLRDFNLPIRINENCSLRFTDYNGNCEYGFGYHGFLVKNSDIPTF